MKRWLWILAGAALLAFALFVWATPYRYFDTSNALLRQNRITGHIKMIQAVDGKLVWTEPNTIGRD